MKNIKIVFSIVFLLFLMLGSIAQNTASVLNAEDVNRFIKTFIPLGEELEALGKSMEVQEGDFSYLAAFATNTKVLAVFKKYGWDEKIGIKWTAISMAYGTLKMDEAMEGMPAAQRAQYKEMLKMSGQPQMSTLVSEQDKMLVKAKIKELEDAFESYD